MGFPRLSARNALTRTEMNPIDTVRLMPQSLTDDEFRDRAALALAAALTTDRPWKGELEDLVAEIAFNIADALVVERARRRAERERA